MVVYELTDGLWVAMLHETKYVAWVWLLMIDCELWLLGLDYDSLLSEYGLFDVEWKLTIWSMIVDLWLMSKER